MVRAGLWFGCLVFAAYFGSLVLAAAYQRQLETLKAAPVVVRTKAWAEMVTDCEAHGGVAVPRATTVLGRSADLPACVPQLGD